MGIDGEPTDITASRDLTIWSTNQRGEREQLLGVDFNNSVASVQKIIEKIGINSNFRIQEAAGFNEEYLPEGEINTGSVP